MAVNRKVPQWKYWQQQEVRLHLLSNSQCICLHHKTNKKKIVRYAKYRDMQYSFLIGATMFLQPLFTCEHIFFLPIPVVLVFSCISNLIYFYSWFFITKGFSYWLIFTTSGKYSADLNVVSDYRESLCEKSQKLQWGSWEPAAYNREALPVTLSQPAGGERLSTGSFSKNRSQRRRIISNF